VRVEDWRLGPTGADGVPNVYRGFTGTLRIVDGTVTLVSVGDLGGFVG
jgi:hypothetical protein